MSMKELCLVVFGCLSLLVCVQCGYVPEYGKDAETVFTTEDGGFRFPNDDKINDRNYFISELNFDLISDAVVTGAADELYVLRTEDLSQCHVYKWQASQENVEACKALDSSSQENVDFICKNHIRVYQRLPGNTSPVLVCGTQAVTEPQCRVLEVGAVCSGDDGDVVEYDPVMASPGLVSYYPQFSQFGEFRSSYEYDSIYLSAGFFNGDAGAGRHFSISYKNITTATDSDPNTLETTELFRTISANNNWLRFPVTFVGLERADYNPSFSPIERETDYQFWFLFFRENLVTAEVVYSRVARICRNDPGSAQPLDDAHFFTTFMKARIFCERHKPSSLEFTATLDYTYNSITSFVFSEEGRYYSNDAPPKKLLYGSFTGPSNGPVGSALCVYPADNSVETAPGAGRTKSVFDIFREDITDDLTDTPKENTFLECAPGGRPEDDQQLLFINPEVSIEQLGDDPILVLDDVIVTQMVQDTVCVVRRDDRLSCLNQDILFLGLDSGRVLKVVFGTDDNGNIEPIIAEDIELDPGDVRNITAMSLRMIGEEKFLFVSTDTRLYKLPLQRCSRFPKCSCRDCVASRDPYCVYNTASSLCEANTLTESLPVDPMYRQNVHTGNISMPCDCPNMGVSSSEIIVREGAGSVEVNLTTTQEVDIQVITVPGTALASLDYQPLSATVQVVSHKPSLLRVVIVDDEAFEPDQQFAISFSADVGVVFESNPITVTIQENDGSSGVEFELRFQSSLKCGDLLEMDGDFTSDLVASVVGGIVGKCARDCSDFTSQHVIDTKIITSCTDTWSLALAGQLLSSESSSADPTLTSALDDWVATGPEVTIGGGGGGVTLTPYCASRCTPTTDTPSASGLASGNDDMYSEAEFGVVLFFMFVFLSTTLGLALVLLILFIQKMRLSKKQTDDVDSAPATATPTGPDSRPPPVNHSISYNQAQGVDPCSSLQRLLPARSEDSHLKSLDSAQVLAAVLEEDRPMFAGPDDDIIKTSPAQTNDVALSANTAYGVRGVKRNEFSESAPGLMLGDGGGNRVKVDMSGTSAVNGTSTL